MNQSQIVPAESLRVANRLPSVTRSFPSNERSFTMRKVSIVLSFVVMGALTSRAQAVTILNPGFESPTVTDGNYADSTLPTSWSKSAYSGTGVAGTANPSAGQLSPIFGDNVAYLYNGAATANSPFLFQNLGLPDPNTIYSLSGYVGDRSGGFFVFPTGGVTLNLHIGSTAIADIVASIAITSSPGDGVAAQYTTSTFTTGNTVTQNMFVTLAVVNGTTQYNLATFDNLQLSAISVPEPTSILMLGVGTVGMLFVNRRRRRIA